MILHVCMVGCVAPDKIQFIVKTADSDAVVIFQYMKCPSDVELPPVILNTLQKCGWNNRTRLNSSGRKFFYRWIGGWKTHPADPGSESKNSFQWNHAAPWEVEIP